MVGVAIAVGLAMFSPTLAEANKDAIVNDLMNISQYAYRYKLTPTPFGGGGRVYTGFIIPDKLNQTDYADYVAEANGQTVTFTATSKLGFGEVTAELDSMGQIGQFTFTGGW
jgi:microcystin-dependent protein